MFAKIKPLTGFAAMAALGLGFTSHANAQNLPDFMEGLHPYVGANYGFYKSGTGDYDEERDLWEVYAGLALHKYFGVEVNYADVGDLTSEAADVGIEGWGASVVGQLPVTDSFSLYAKLGQFFYDAEVDLDELDATYDGDEPFYTIGAGFSITDPVTVTLEYTRFNADVDIDQLDQLVDNSDVGDLDTAKIGIRFAF
jgi:OOP family OmpA-OmpF porin